MTYKLAGTQLGDISVPSLSRKVYEPKRKKWTTYWECLCLCGKVFEAETTTLDRKEVNRNYCKDNCKWSDRSEQGFNRR